MASMLKKIVGSGACVVLGVSRRCSSRTLLAGTHEYSTQRKENVPAPEAEVTKSVFMSQSTDIFTNLALEDWLFRNYDFSSSHVMMVWRSDPCVVVGRHQNPWQEANLPLLKEKEIALARRNSGGGAVYHDRGNLNVSFFMPRERYDRAYNLQLIQRALFREFGVSVDINERQDLVVGKHKISGTASKLGRLTAYHHCTLLVNADKAMLSSSLAKHEHGIQSKATTSTRSPVANLAELNKRITVDTLQTALGWEYLRTPALHIADGGPALISKQRGFQYVNPTEAWFPGLESLKGELESWDWCYGRTPVFTVSRTFPVPAELLPAAAPQQLAINVSVERGLIADVTLSVPPGLLESGLHGEASVVTQLRGKRFTEEALAALQEAMLRTRHHDSRQLDERELFVAKCFEQVVNTM